MWLLIILLLTSCSSKIEIIPNTDCIDIKVNVSGAVMNEGTIKLPCGSVFDDLLNQIVLAENADISMFHSNMPLFDGDNIVILEQNEFRISINTASKEELMTLKGIGEKTAEAIIEYRNVNGFFINIIDIKNVKGIGDRKYEAIKDFISL